ncbi:MAG: hypothetical protein JRI97_06325 [Deltaproteobacteria bacterium]|nr:hypothetical protein [Deltaproteobacteria bacterium]
MHRIVTCLLVFALAACPTLGYEFSDAVVHSAPDEKGVEAGLKLMDYLGASSKWEPDDKMMELFTFLTDSFKEFNFDRVYESRHLMDRPDGTRGLTFAGIYSDDTFSLNVLDRGEPTPELSTIGSFIADFSLEKNKNPVRGKTSFLASLEFNAATETLSHENIVRLLTGFLRVLDPANLQELANEAGEDLDRYDAIDNFREAFPRFMGYLDRYFTFESISQIRARKNIPYNHFSMTWGYKERELGKEFPRIADFLEDLEGITQVSGNGVSMDGDLLYTFSLAPRPKAFTFEVFTREGKVLPVVSFGSAGAPVFERAFSMEDLTEYSFRNNISIQSNVKGLHFDTPHVKSTTRYSDSETDMLLYAGLNQTGRTSISGLAFHIIPVWIIDLFIPGNMEEITNSFSTVLERGNRGKGAYMEVAWDTSEPGKYKYRWHGEAEFLDNYYVRFGMRVISDAMRADERTVEEMRRLGRTALEKLRQDLLAMKEKTA